MGYVCFNLNSIKRQQQAVLVSSPWVEFDLAGTQYMYCTCTVFQPVQVPAGSLCPIVTLLHYAALSDSRGTAFVNLSTKWNSKFTSSQLKKDWLLELESNN